MRMFGRSLLLLAWCCSRFLDVGCTNDSRLSYAISVTTNATNAGDSDLLTVKGDGESKCYDGLCKSYEVCYQVKDPASRDVFAMCKCKNSDTRCRHGGVPVPGSTFDVVEKYEVLQRRRRNDALCSRDCGPHSECKVVMGDEICVRRRVCDKESRPCKNDGKCVRHNSRGEYRCACTVGYQGKHCEEKIPSKGKNPCGPDTCPSGNCVPIGTDDFVCKFPVDPCHSSPCNLGQSCQPKVLAAGESSYHCVDENPCAPNPCAGGCQCKSSCKHEGGYFCQGENGLLGKNCDIPAPDIACGGKTIAVSVNSRIVDEYGGGEAIFALRMAQLNSLYNSTGCTATENGTYHRFSISWPFTGCGTVVSDDGDVTRVSGTIWLYRAYGTAQVAIPVVEFVCRYEKQYKIITSIVPAQTVFHSPSGPDRLPNDRPYQAWPIITGHGTLNSSATIELCKAGESCPNRCPADLSLKSGAIYTVNEGIHVRIMPTHKGSNLHLNDLFISCSRDPSKISAVIGDLVTASCVSVASRRSLQFRARNSGGGVCLSFHVPTLKECSGFYIHANLKDCSKNCEAKYHGCSVRRKRSVNRRANHIFGPVYVMDLHAGVLESILYPGDDDFDNTTVPSTTDGKRPNRVPFRILMTAGIIAIVVVFVLTAYNWYNYRRGKSGRF